MYRRTCDLCGVEKIGVYAPDKPYRVYCAKCWWGDGWEGGTYGRDYDFSRPFFAQFRDLMREAPLLSRFVYEDTITNSEYTNMAGYMKDCYLTFNAGSKTGPVERLYYSEHSSGAHDCYDVAYAEKSELCANSVNIQNCYKVFFSRDVESSRDSWFLNCCSGCDNCFGCVNLRNKKYHIFNQPYSKEEYEKKLKELGWDPGSQESLARLRKMSEDAWASGPQKYIHGLRNLNASGDYVFNSKNVQHAFAVNASENSRYIAFITQGAKDCYDWTQYGDGGELIYDTVQSGEGVYNNRFGWTVWRQTKNSEYGILNVTLSDCFGCVALRNKQFCILNKQYSEEEYHALKAKIIAHMNEMPYVDAQGRTWKYGEFFPPELSPFAYNETTAWDEFPLSEEEAKAKDYPWLDKEKYKKSYPVTLAAAGLPDHIDQADDSVLKEVIGCADCGKPYQIIRQEVDFYRAHQLPLPRLCLDCRYAERRKAVNPMRLWPRRCECLSGRGSYKNAIAHFHGEGPCPNEFETSYAPDRPELVYCEACYQKEVA